MGDVETLAKSLRRNGLAATDADAIRMAEKMLGVSRILEQKGRERQEFSMELPKPKTKELPVVKLEDIEPVSTGQEKEKFDISKDTRTVKELHEKAEKLEVGFKEIPVEKKEKPALTKEEKEKVDLSKWFYCGNK